MNGIAQVWGRGAHRVIAACKAHGAVKPIHDWSLSVLIDVATRSGLASRRCQTVQPRLARVEKHRPPLRSDDFEGSPGWGHLSHLLAGCPRRRACRQAGNGPASRHRILGNGGKRHGQDIRVGHSPDSGRPRTERPRADRVHLMTNYTHCVKERL